MVLFKERLNHIIKKHSYIDNPVIKVKEAVEAPDKILKNSKQVNTVVKISVDDNKENSIITAMIIRKNRVEKLQNKNKILCIKKKK